MSFIANSSNIIRANGPEKLHLVLVTLFTGFFGGQMFFIGKPKLGLFCLFFCWTGIPAVLAIIDLVRYFLMSDEAIRYEYETSTLAFLSALGAFVLMAGLAGLWYMQAQKTPQAIAISAPAAWTATQNFIASYEAVQKVQIDINRAAVPRSDLEIPYAAIPEGFELSEPRPGNLEWTSAGGTGAFPAGCSFGIRCDAAGIFSHYTLNVERAVLDSCLPGFLPSKL